MASASLVMAKKKTVLVVDDDPAMTNLLRFMLSRLGYSAIFADDGEKALTVAVATLPDCILLDLAMPNLDGYGFLVTKARCAPLQDIPTIVLSAKNRSHEVKRAIKLGAFGYVAKPVEAKKLAAHLGQFARSVYSTPLTTAASWRP